MPPRIVHLKMEGLESLSAGSPLLRDPESPQGCRLPPVQDKFLSASKEGLTSRELRVGLWDSQVICAH